MNTANALPMEEIIQRIHRAIMDCGYDPIKQFSGYILSEDPTYIPDYNNARGLIRHVDRDELLRFLIRYYLEHESEEASV